MPDIALLRIEIDEVTPAVVRRVEVPVTIRLDDLHFVLQIAIGWQNCHPFEFRSGETPGASSIATARRRARSRRRPRRSPTCWRAVTHSNTTMSTARIGRTRSRSRRSRRPRPIRRIRASSARKADVRPLISADHGLRDLLAGDRRSRAPSPRRHDRMGRSRLRSPYGGCRCDREKPGEPRQISRQAQGRALKPQYRAVSLPRPLRPHYNEG